MGKTQELSKACRKFLDNFEIDFSDGAQLEFLKTIFLKEDYRKIMNLI